jgi:GTPase
LLGPDALKHFKSVTIKSIHINRVNCSEAYSGELACICVKAVKATEKLIRKDIRRGMVVIDNDKKP